MRTTFIKGKLILFVLHVSDISRRELTFYLLDLCIQGVKQTTHPTTLFSTWAEKFICCDAIVEFDQMWLFFNIVSPAGHTFLPLVLPPVDSCGIEDLILIILGKSPQLQIHVRPHHWSDTVSQPSVFSCLGTETSQMVSNQENMEGVINQFKATLMQAGALSWWNN